MSWHPTPTSTPPARRGGRCGTWLTSAGETAGNDRIKAQMRRSCQPKQFRSALSNSTHHATRTRLLTTSLGLNHTIAPVEVRERLAFGPERLPAALTSASRPAGGRRLVRRRHAGSRHPLDLQPHGGLRLGHGRCPKRAIRCFLAERGGLDDRGVGRLSICRRCDERRARTLPWPPGWTRW